MFERLTDRARRIVVLAQSEARLLNHNYIGTEHMLAAMLGEGEGVAAQALSKFDMSLDGVRDQITTIIGRGQQAPSGHIPFTPRAKKVLELSLREALQIGHNYIGTEHILLGLIREGEGVGAQIIASTPGMIRELHVRDKPWDALLRDQVMAILGEFPVEKPEPEPDYGHEVSGPGPGHHQEELKLLDALRVHVLKRQSIIAEAELAWLAETSALGAHEAREHEINQQLIDLHSRAVTLAASAGQMLAAASDLRAHLEKLIPAPPSETGEVDDNDDS